MASELSDSEAGSTDTRWIKRGSVPSELSAPLSRGSGGGGGPGTPAAAVGGASSRPCAAGVRSQRAAGKRRTHRSFQRLHLAELAEDGHVPARSGAST
jgi:hypothetical protein